MCYILKLFTLLIAPQTANARLRVRTWVFPLQSTWCILRTSRCVFVYSHHEWQTVGQIQTTKPKHWNSKNSQECKTVHVAKPLVNINITTVDREIFCHSNNSSVHRSMKWNTLCIQHATLCRKKLVVCKWYHTDDIILQWINQITSLNPIISLLLSGGTLVMKQLCAYSTEWMWFAVLSNGQVIL